MRYFIIWNMSKCYNFSLKPRKIVKQIKNMNIFGIIFTHIYKNETIITFSRHNIFFYSLNLKNNIFFICIL
jgi:hypothetical protein